MNDKPEEAKNQPQLSYVNLITILFGLRTKGSEVVNVEAEGYSSKWKGWKLDVNPELGTFLFAATEKLDDLLASAELNGEFVYKDSVLSFYSDQRDLTRILGVLEQFIEDRVPQHEKHRLKNTISKAGSIYTMVESIFNDALQIDTEVRDSSEVAHPNCQQVVIPIDDITASSKLIRKNISQVCKEDDPRIAMSNFILDIDEANISPRELRFIAIKNTEIRPIIEQIAAAAAKLSEVAEQTHATQKR